MQIEKNLLEKNIMISWLDHFITLPDLFYLISSLLIVYFVVLIILAVDLFLLYMIVNSLLLNWCNFLNWYMCV